MRLYVDAMFFRATGLGRVVVGALDVLSREEWVESIDTAVPAPMESEFRARFGSPKLVVHPLPYGPMSVADLSVKFRLLHRLRHRVDLFYFPSHNVPVAAPAPFVLSVNDTIPLSPAFKIDPVRRAGFRWLLQHSLSRAAGVITLTESTRGEVQRELPFASAPIDVVPPPVADLFFLDPDRSAPSCDTSGGGRVRLLFVGARFSHKNLRTLLEAFSILAPARPGLELSIAGPRRERYDDVDRWRARSGALGARVEEHERLTDDELVGLLARSDLLVFPSLAEGFGLPPLEAMAAGVPVVCSDLPVMRETCAGAAEFADPRRAADLARAIGRVLDDEAERRRLVTEGRRRAACFRSDVVAERFRAVARRWATALAARDRPAGRPEPT